MTNLIGKHGFFRSALNAIVEARSREAQRMIDAYEAKSGYTRADRLARRSISAGF